MTLVVDSSVAVKWTVDEPGSDEALELAPRALIAPDLFQTEVGNVLTKKVRARELSSNQARLAFQRTLARVSLVRSAPFGQSAFDLSLALAHSIYDCYFLAVSLDHGPLVTADATFASKVRETGFRGLVYLLGEELPDE